MENNLIGKKRIFMQIRRTFGQLGLEYYKFKVTKCYKKSCRVEHIDGMKNSYYDLIPIENLGKYYFKSMKKALEWNIANINYNVDRFELKLTETKKNHEDHKRLSTELKILRDTLKLLNNFSYEGLSKLNDKYQDFYKEQTKKFLGKGE